MPCDAGGANLRYVRGLNGRKDTLLLELLQLPDRAIGYEAGRRLKEMYPEHALFATSDGHFDLNEFVRDGQCTLVEPAGIHTQHDHLFDAHEGTRRNRKNGWFSVRWNGVDFDVIWLEWSAGYCQEKWVGIVADDLASAQRFFEAVCAYCSEVRSEVLVFSGSWAKSKTLYNDIQKTTLDSLIIEPTLAEEIEQDLTQFLESQSYYDKYNVPWKRGLLLVGPPGNGKTHCVKGLINRFRLPCLYVRSFNAQFGSPEANVHTVFHRARRAAPCFLVFEDIDALVTRRIRAYFLNELDGFATNHGLITIGTTNYPERLDPALSERPSRFDVKYVFPLPSVNERRRYLQRWSARLDAAMQPSPDTIDRVAAQTQDFSFAFLKELTTSSMVTWANQHGAASMNDLLVGRVQRLRPQLGAEAPLASVASLIGPDPDADDPQED